MNSRSKYLPPGLNHTESDPCTDSVIVEQNHGNQKNHHRCKDRPEEEDRMKSDFLGSINRHVTRPCLDNAGACGGEDLADQQYYDLNLGIDLMNQVPGLIMHTHR